MGRAGATWRGEFDLDMLADSLGQPGENAAETAIWELNVQERVELAALLRLEGQQ